MMETDMPTVDHPPYSPDLSPADYFLFPRIKKALSGHGHKTIPELQAEILRVVQEVNVVDFAEAMFKMPLRWRKCVAAGGDYFEGDHLPINGQDSDTPE